LAVHDAAARAPSRNRLLVAEGDPILAADISRRMRSRGHELLLQGLAAGAAAAREGPAPDLLVSRIARHRDAIVEGQVASQ